MRIATALPAAFVDSVCLIFQFASALWLRLDHELHG